MSSHGDRFASQTVVEEGTVFCRFRSVSSEGSFLPRNSLSARPGDRRRISVALELSLSNTHGHSRNCVTGALVWWLRCVINIAFKCQVIFNVRPVHSHKRPPMIDSDFLRYSSYIEDFTDCSRRRYPNQSRLQIDS